VVVLFISCAAPLGFGRAGLFAFQGQPGALGSAWHSACVID
jgi:hypothetical protein